MYPDVAADQSMESNSASVSPSGDRPDPRLHTAIVSTRPRLLAPPDKKGVISLFPKVAQLP